MTDNTPAQTSEELGAGLTVQGGQSGLVSVIVPMYNRAWSIERCIRSVFEQTYRPIECLVVDDGSVDDGKEVAGNLVDAAPQGVLLRVLEKQNGGPNSARNLGLRFCCGEFVCFLDSDDYLPKDSIGCRASLLEENPDAGFSYGRTAVIDSRNQQVGTLNDPWPGANEARVARYLFVSSAPLIRRSLCAAIGPWLESDHYGQEYEYFSRLKYHCRHAAFSYDIVSFYVRHEQDHVFDSSLEFEHAVYRVLSTVQGLVLFSECDTQAERQALAIEFTKLGVRLYRLRDYRTTLLAWGTAFWLEARLKRFFGCLWCMPLALLSRAGAPTEREMASREQHNNEKGVSGSSKFAFVKTSGERGTAGDSSRYPPPNICGDGEILAWWTGGFNNWGDIVTPFILGSLTGLKVRRGHGKGCIYSVGSIIDKVRTGGQIWGCGILSRDHCADSFPDDIKVHAVRGPLTRGVLVDAGLEVPEIFGDPVLLMPYLCQAESIPSEGIGIICHYNDVTHLGKVAETEPYRIIDIQAGLKEVIEQVLACEAIVSTSLHGLVLAEAYGKPAAWLQIDKGKRLAGGDFKFRDYLLSTNRKVVRNRVKSGEIVRLGRMEWLPAPEIDLQPLLSAFPAMPGLKLRDLKPVSLEEL